MPFRFLTHSVLARFLFLIGALLLMPLFLLPFYPQDTCYTLDFVLPALLSFAFGGILSYRNRNLDEDSLFSSHIKSMQSSSQIVLAVWGWGIFTGALPFILSGQLTFVQALFESVSGWTTTGLSVMNVEETSHIFLFYRSLMQYCGGLGFVLMIVMLISGKQAMGLFHAEGHSDKLMPNLKKTARTIFLMYFLFLLIGTLNTWLVGMDFFDALCHTMCALSTGGFSTKLNSIGEYNSFAVELSIIFLMLAGTTNFAVLLLLVKGKWSQFCKVSEVRFMALLIAILVPLTGISLSNAFGFGIHEGLRRAFFDIVSALSTSGYSTMSYQDWPPTALGLLICAMLIGGGIGSTAGGIKLSRVYLMLRLLGQNIKSRIHSARLVQTAYYTRAQGKTEIDRETAEDTCSFINCYFLLFIIGSLLLTVTADCTLTEAMFEFASSIGTVGLSIGLTGPATNNATLFVEMAGMILGRLEIFIIITGLYSFATRKCQGDGSD